MILNAVTSASKGVRGDQAGVKMLQSAGAQRQVSGLPDRPPGRGVVRRQRRGTAPGQPQGEVRQIIWCYRWAKWRREPAAVTADRPATVRWSVSEESLEQFVRDLDLKAMPLSRSRILTPSTVFQVVTFSVETNLLNGRSQRKNQRCRHNIGVVDAQPLGEAQLSAILDDSIVTTPA